MTEATKKRGSMGPSCSVSSLSEDINGLELDRGVEESNLGAIPALVNRAT